MDKSKPKSITEQVNKYLTDSKQRSYFVIAVTVFFVLLIFMMGIRPAFSAVIRQNSNNGKRDDVIAGLTVKVSTLNNLKNEYETKENIVNYFKEVFPDSLTQENVIDEISTFEDQSGVDVSSITFSEAGRDLNLVRDFFVRPLVTAQIFTISAKGDKNELIDFVNRLEDSRRIYNVTELTISREFIQTGDGLVGGDFLLTVSGYFYYLNKITTPVQ